MREYRGKNRYPVLESHEKIQMTDQITNQIIAMNGSHINTNSHSVKITIDKMCINKNTELKHGKACK